MKEGNFEKQYDLETFRAEMAELKRQEEAKEVSTGHFIKTPGHDAEMDPMELTEDDMRAWERVSEGNIDQKAYLEYKDKVVAEEFAKGLGWDNSSRLIFVNFLSNRIRPWSMEIE